MKEAGAHAVKFEGGARVLPQVELLARSGIPVMGHLGLTPQTATIKGGHKAQGRQAEGARALFADALAVQAAGCFGVVLEAVPPQVSQAISRRLDIVTIGIGSGAGTDGQVLVLHDMLGIRSSDGPQPRFVKHYAEVGDVMKGAIERYATEVRGGEYPAAEHTYSMPPEEVEAFERAIGAGSIEENALADW